MVSFLLADGAFAQAAGDHGGVLPVVKREVRCRDEALLSELGECVAREFAEEFFGDVQIDCQLHEKRPYAFQFSAAVEPSEPDPPRAVAETSVSL
jgi:hypothetical protein